jgi:hypothetical protein
LIADIDTLIVYTVPENNPRDLEKTDKYDQILTANTHTLPSYTQANENCLNAPPDNDGKNKHPSKKESVRSQYKPAQNFFF